MDNISKDDLAIIIILFLLGFLYLYSSNNQNEQFIDQVKTCSDITPNDCKSDLCPENCKITYINKEKGICGCKNKEKKIEK